MDNIKLVDGLVDNIAYSLGIGRDSLNIVAASVGVGVVIPPIREVQELDVAACQWILVIEKEATFRTLAASGYWNTSLAGPGALVTSKGYPTLVTRRFLHRIHETAPRLPVYGLVDFDPYGVRIFRTYKYSSQSLGHELNTTVPGLKWLGIRSCDLVPPNNASSSYHAWSALDYVLPLTDTDRRAAVSLLKEIHHSVYGDQDEANLEQCREVQVMLMVNVKAEIQAADDYGDLAAWLDNKLCQAQEGDDSAL
ncbi:endodeoxyribonuclease [Sporothrix eucalyptigena]|uniref:Endodeoxyribonuclease n=1 Tax=Sporothrix eucalyptigena TaxID=1812306 RepID=A0ABP0C196_9PEZI